MFFFFIQNLFFLLTHSLTSSSLVSGGFNENGTTERMEVFFSFHINFFTVHYVLLENGQDENE
jgi:hypothetical protein